MRSRSSLAGSAPSVAGRAVLLALFLAALLGCSTSKGDSVAVLGDSITALDEPALVERFGDDHPLSVTGQFGHTVEEMLPDATRVASEATFDQVIVNLGTNDVLQGVPVQESVAALGQIIDTFGSAACIHVVNINEHMVDPESGEALTEPAEQLNEQYSELAGVNSRVSIIDWAGETSQTLNDEQPAASTLTTDTVHPTGAGNELLNDLYSDALEGCRQVGP